MSALPLRHAVTKDPQRSVSNAPAPDDERVLLQQLLGEVRELRAEVRGIFALFRKTNAEAAFEAAMGEYFGDGRFTVDGLFAVAEQEPHGELANALCVLVDVNAAPRARATALGMRLRRMAAVEVVAKQRGCAVYRLRTSGE